VKTVAILGIDGYIGWPLALDLLSKDYKVAGLDYFSRRDRVRHLGSNSLTPICDTKTRNEILRSYPNFIDSIACINMTDINIYNFLEFCKPDVIVHLAEQPSAPWSMYNARNSEITQRENVLGTLNILWGIHRICPEAHLIKLGSMGDYGTPECDIPEGVVPEGCLASYGGYHPSNSDYFVEYGCPMSGLLFPRTPNSFYHLANVHNTHNIYFACRNWGLRSTDIMQGIVFGLNETNNNNNLLTRFDYDEYFGTVINRFCAQALINYPLTIYGKGNQIRSFMSLKDSIQCLEIAIENPPHLGEYRTFNQFENIYSINQLAKIVQGSAHKLGMQVDITPIPNPRKESEDHYYNPVNNKLFDLGYISTTDTQAEITKLLSTLKPFSSRIKPNVIMPKTQW
jgi:nucleoside-diphosphate-sugar epimerase